MSESTTLRSDLAKLNEDKPVEDVRRAPASLCLRAKNW